MLPDKDLTFIFLSNLQSASNWQIRAQIRRILLNQDADVVSLPKTIAAQFEKPELLVGSFGRAKISIQDGKLFRGNNEFYPIEGGRYYIPASGSMMKFRRDKAGKVDALISIRPGGRQTVLIRLPTRDNDFRN